MTTYYALTKEDIELSLEKLKQLMLNILEKQPDKQLIVTTDFAGGTISIPNGKKNKNGLKGLPPIFCFDIFEPKFAVINLSEGIGFTALFVPKGTLLEKLNEPK